MSDKLEAYIAELDTSEPIKALFRRYGLSYTYLAMASVMLAMLATLLTGTIINVAIPQIMGSYGVGQDKAQWLSTAYLAAATVGMLTTSWVIQAWGMRIAVASTMTVFMFGSLLGGLSPNLEVMIIARIIQGATSGMITPLTMLIIFQLYPAGKQGVAMGISSIGAILAPALGPTVGGLLVDIFNWRYVYYLGVPFSFLCIPMALLFLPDRAGPKIKQAFDWPGMVSLSTAVTLLLIAFSNGEKQGWSSNIIIGYFVGAIASGALFIYWQVHSKSPLLNLKLFSYLRFSIFAITAFVFGAGLFGSTYLIPLFLQLVQGMSPTETGLSMMPAGIVMGVAIPFCGRMADKYNPGSLISWGAVLFFLSFYLMIDADANTGFWMFAWWMCIGRLGISLAMPPMNMGAIRSVPMEYISQASGALNFVRQLGGAFGVNLLSVALARRTEFHLDAIYSTQRSDNVATLEMLHALQQRLVVTGLPEIERSVIAMQHLASSLYMQASVSAFRDSFLIASLVFLLTLIPAWFMRKNHNTKH